MTAEKKIWLIEQYAQKVWTVSLTLAQEAACAGEHGRGYAVVANETRTLANNLFDYVGRIKFDPAGADDFKEVADFATMMKLLCVNADLEAVNGATVSMDYNIPKSMAVFADDLRTIAGRLGELANGDLWRKPFVVPELANPTESGANDCFTLFTVGGHPLLENMRYINEVFYRSRTDFAAGTLSVRGTDIPVVDCYRRLGLAYPQTEWQPLLIIRRGPFSGTHEMHAVPIDDLGMRMLYYTRVGRSVAPKPAHPFAAYARDCWDMVGGDQAVFADWNKLQEV
jgi:hypothetical protein